MAKRGSFLARRPAGGVVARSVFLFLNFSLLLRRAMDFPFFCGLETPCLARPKNLSRREQDTHFFYFILNENLITTKFQSSLDPHDTWIHKLACGHLE
jgi:hypothetical protein